jgi:two-component system response regulator
VNQAAGRVEILLVEDSPKDAEMTRRALRKFNFGERLRWVKDGEEALDFIFCRGAFSERDAARPPKLILLDLKMPKVNGIEVLRQVKDDGRMRSIPVVVMTSSNEEHDVMESYRLGANSYIVKPVEFGAFADVVEKIGLYWILANRVPE